MKKVFVSIALCSCLNILAQNSTDSIQKLPEVTVRGVKILTPTSISKIPITPSEVPLTVNLITKQSIQNMSYLNVTEALRDVPGVNAFRDYGAFDMFFVRGFHQAVVLYDGIRDERHTIWQSAPITGLSSIESIEVLKGASSMSVGHSALGGVINIVRKKPTRRLSLNTDITVGSYGTINTQAGVSKALSDKLLFRVDGEIGRSDGWRDNFSRIMNGHVALEYQISPRQTLSLSAMANKDRYRGDYGQPHLKWDVFRADNDKLAQHKGSFNPTVDRTVFYSDPKDELKNSNISLHARYKTTFANNWKLNNHIAASFDDINYYSTDGLNYLTDTASTRFPYYYLDGGNKVYISLDSIQRDGFAFKYKTKSIQNQLDINKTYHWKNTSHHLLIGYNFAYMHLPRFDRASYTGTGAGSILSVTNPQVNQGPIEIHYTRQQKFSDMVHALYLQDYINWEKWSFLAGIRLDHFKRKYVINDTNGEIIEKEVYNKTTKNIAFTYRLGIVYKATPNLNIYTSTSNMYKPQRTALSSDVIYINSNGNEMSPDELTKISPLTGTQYEIGARFDRNNQLSINASIYHISLNNVLKSNLGQTRDGKSIGGLVGRSASKGIEIELSYSPIPNVELQANYAYTDARVKKYSSYSNNNVQAGNKLERVPTNKLSGWAFLKQPIQQQNLLRIGIGTEHNGKAYTEETNTFVIPAYTIFHMMVAYTAGAYTLQINVNNLLDKTYYRNVLNSVQYIPAQGRHILASIRFMM